MLDTVAICQLYMYQVIIVILQNNHHILLSQMLLCVWPDCTMFVCIEHIYPGVVARNALVHPVHKNKLYYTFKVCTDFL